MRSIRLATGPLFAALLVAAAGAVSCATTGAQSANAPSGQAADFTLESVDGQRVALSQYLGKDVVLIDFWATWCEPCLAEMPHLSEIYKANKDKGFVVLGVAMDGPETVAEVRAYAQRNRLAFPVLLDQESRAVSLYNPRRAAPYSVLIGRDGTVIKKRDGYVPGDEKAVEADVTAALAPR